MESEAFSDEWNAALDAIAASMEQARQQSNDSVAPAEHGWRRRWAYLGNRRGQLAQEGNAMMDRPPNDLAELAEEVAQFLRGRFKHPLVSRVELEVLKPATPENLLAEQSATITMQVNTRRVAEYTLKFSVEHSPS